MRGGRNRSDEALLVPSPTPRYSRRVSQRTADHTAPPLSSSSPCAPILRFLSHSAVASSPFSPGHHDDGKHEARKTLRAARGMLKGEAARAAGGTIPSSQDSANKGDGDEGGVLLMRGACQPSHLAPVWATQTIASSPNRSRLNRNRFSLPFLPSLPPLAAAKHVPKCFVDRLGVGRYQCTDQHRPTSQATISASSRAGGGGG